MRYPTQETILWQFDTANLRVVLHVEPEEMDPADSFSEQEDIDAVREGRVEWFCAFVSVWAGADEDGLTYLAHDVLGGCAYSTFREFYTSHRDADPANRNTLALKAQNRAICHYFPSMVSEACAAARVELAKLQSIHVRAAA